MRERRLLDQQPIAALLVLGLGQDVRVELGDRDLLLEDEVGFDLGLLDPVERLKSIGVVLLGGPHRV